MAIRIAGGQPPVPPVEETPEVPEAPMEQEEAVSKPAMLHMGGKFSVDKVSPMVARYMTSDMGPFICSNCEHYTADGECEVVSGPIDPEGVCILFTPHEAEAESDELEQDLETAPVVEEEEESEA